MKFAIKAGIIFFILILSVVVLSQIDFPSPNKKIEVILPNENFKYILVVELRNLINRE